MSKLSNDKKRSYWAAHVSACEGRDISLADYAREQGLELKAFYRWKTRLVKKTDFPAQKPTPSFVPVRVVTPTSSCRVMFPNGIVVEWSDTDVNVLSALAMLRFAA